VRGGYRAVLGLCPVRVDFSTDDELQIPPTESHSCPNAFTRSALFKYTLCC
jgi:hypothetical protein